MSHKLNENKFLSMNLFIALITVTYKSLHLIKIFQNIIHLFLTSTVFLGEIDCSEANCLKMKEIFYGGYILANSRLKSID